MDVPFFRPSLGEEEIEAATRVIRSGWLTTGAEAIAFEEEFARFTESRHALSVNSCTAGLHLALEALGVREGDKVAVPAYNFTSSAEVQRYLGAEAVFLDSEPGGFNLSLESLQKAIEQEGSALKGVIPVHMAGEVCDMASLNDMAKENNLFVLEDAAHSFPAPTSLGHAGAMGDAGVYSFYATKAITTGEGGMVVTNREDITERMKVMRLHGFDRTAWNRYQDKKASWHYEVVAPGFKYNMTDLAAAIGRVQLAKADTLAEKRKKIALAYTKSFEGFDFLRVPAEGLFHTYHLYILRIVPDKLTITRDELIEKLKEKGIHCSVHFIPLYRMPYWRDRYSLKKEDFPEAEKAFRAAISLPLYPDMTEEMRQYVSETLLDICRNHYKGRD